MIETPHTSITIHVWTDFVCPFCLLGERIIEEATQGLPVQIEWMPFELRPYPTPTLKPEDEYLPRVWKASVYPMAARLGVPIQLPTVSTALHAQGIPGASIRQNTGQGQ